MFESRQLLVLSQVARTGSYTAAAAALGYTQPAVSYQMRMLARSAGTPLVTHAGRGVRLTEAGRALARHATVVLAALRTAENEISALASQGHGRVRLAAFQSSYATLVPPMLEVLRRTHPDIEVRLIQAEPPEAAEQLRAGDVDLGLLCDWEAESLAESEIPLRRVPLMVDRRCVLMPVSHPLAGDVTIDFADLAGEKWVMESSRDRFLNACGAAGFTPRITATADDQVTIQSLVAGDVGIALMNELGLATHLDPRLVARPLRGWPLRRVYALLWPDMIRVPAVAAVLEALGAAARSVSVDLRR